MTSIACVVSNWKLPSTASATDLRTHSVGESHPRKDGKKIFATGSTLHGELIRFDSNFRRLFPQP
jgi:hypothetical protein